jgi:hypothetical protein
MAEFGRSRSYPFPMCEFRRPKTNGGASIPDGGREATLDARPASSRPSLGTGRDPIKPRAPVD